MYSNEFHLPTTAYLCVYLGMLLLPKCVLSRQYACPCRTHIATDSSGNGAVVTLQTTCRGTEGGKSNGLLTDDYIALATQVDTHELGLGLGLGLQLAWV